MKIETDNIALKFLLNFFKLYMYIYIILLKI